MGSLAAPILARAGEMRLPGASRISYFCNGKIYVSEVGKAEGKPGDEVAMVTFNQNRESKSRHMQAYILLRATLALILCTVLVPEAHAQNQGHWNQFRVPNGDGKSLAKNLPIEFSETKNVRWKTPIHDEGWSSPVV
jgi:hypothetical protein